MRFSPAAIALSLTLAASAQETAPESRIVYVDHDPVAVAHSQAVLAGNEDTDVVAADLRIEEAAVRAPLAKAA